MYIPYKLRILKRSLFKKTQGERRLRREYLQRFGRTLNVDAPVTFSEKMFSRMVRVNRHGDERFTRLADKYLARDYIEEKLSKEHLIKLL